MTKFIVKPPAPKTMQRTLRIDKALDTDLALIAEENGTSVPCIIRQIIESWARDNPRMCKHWWRKENV